MLFVLISMIVGVTMKSRQQATVKEAEACQNGIENIADDRK